MQRLSASFRPADVSRSTRSTAARAPGARRVRSPSTWTATPCPRSSSTSCAMYSSSSPISAEISVRGRCQFSSEKAKRVTTSRPASSAPSTVSRTAFIPARWPRGRGRWRSRAQRPLPSMMTATWRGTAPWSRICERRSSAILDLEDLGLLGLHQLVDLLHVVVVRLLHVLFPVLLLVFGDVLGFLQLGDGLGARVADRHPTLLGEAMHHLHQLLAALLGERRERDANHVPVVGRREAQVRRQNRLLDRLHQTLVPGLDGQEPRFRRRHARHLVQGHLVSVGVHAHQIEQRGGRLAGPYRGELAAHRVHGLVHGLPGLLDLIGDGHRTMVPTRSPPSTLAVAPGWLMLKTTMGSRFSLQSPNALASITP